MDEHRRTSDLALTCGRTPGTAGRPDVALCLDAGLAMVGRHNLRGTGCYGLYSQPINMKMSYDFEVVKLPRSPPRHYRHQMEI